MGSKFCSECGNSLGKGIIDKNQPEAIVPSPNDGPGQITSIIDPTKSDEGSIPEKSGKGLKDNSSFVKTTEDKSSFNKLSGDKADGVGRSDANAERRHLTVLFCDLVGSSSIASKMDAEDYRQYILEYQNIVEEVIDRYRGYVGNYLGDGLLVYFGYPKGLENAPRVAIRCALAIIESLSKFNAGKGEKQNSIRVRMGIHTGLVVVDKQMALGNTVNIAARLEGLAPTNSIVISKATKKLVEGWFELKAFGSHVLKGIDGEMEVFEVLDESLVTSRIEVATGRGLSPLVGREEEVYLLLRNWNQAKQGRGQFLLLNGEAGIGKSRMVASIKAQVKQEKNVAKLELRCSEHHINSPFFPLTDLLEKRVLAFKKDETQESKITKLKDWMNFAEIDKQPNLPIFADFLSVPISDELRDKFGSNLLAATGKRKKFMEGLSTAFFNFSFSQPLLLIVEDLHWMDSSTLEWLNGIVERINAYPLFMLATTRPQFQPTWSNKSFISQWNLLRLNTNRIEAICYHQTQGKLLPEAVLQQIKNKTDGVPLFVEELTRMIIESDLLEEQEDRYVLSPAHETSFELAIPSTLQDSLMARLDKLSGSREVAQIGAVLGREFTFDLLLAVSQMEEHELGEHLTRLADAELLYQRGAGLQTKYIFKHALIQDTAYESLLRSRRQVLHQQVVAALEDRFPELVQSQPALMAHHLTEAGMGEKAISKWQEAGQMAFHKYANRDAVKHFQKAISLLTYIENANDREAKELEICISYAGPLGLYKGWGHGEVEQNSQRVLALCEGGVRNDHTLMGYLGLIGFYLVQVKLALSMQSHEKAIALAKDLGNDGFLVFFYLTLSETHSALGNFDQALSNVNKGLDLYDEDRHQHMNLLGGGELSVYGNCTKGWNLLISGFPDQAKEIIVDNIQFASKKKNFTSLWRVYQYQSGFHLHLKEYEDSKKALAFIMPILEAGGESALLTWAKLLHHIVESALGQYDFLTKAKELLSQIISEGMKYGATSSYYIITEIYLLHGDHKAGMEFMNEALTYLNNNEEKFMESGLYRQKGELLLLQDPKHPEAEHWLLKSREVAQQQSAKWHELLTAKSLVRLWKSQGKISEAYDLLNDIYSWFTEGFDTKDMVEAKELLQELKLQVSKTT